MSYLTNNWSVDLYLYEAWCFYFIMSKLRINIKGSSKIYNMSIIDSPKIGQKEACVKQAFDSVQQTVVQSEPNLILFWIKV